MAGTSIGSIYARIGADTSDFQAKLASSNADLGRWAGGVDGQTVRVESSMLRISRSASTVMTSMGLMGGQVDFAIARILGSIGLLELAFPAAMIVMAPKIGEFINKITGLRDVFATAAPPAKAMAEDLANNAQGFEDARTGLIHLCNQLNVAQPLWLMSGIRTLENAENTVRMTMALQKLIVEHKADAKETAAYIVQAEIANAKRAETTRLLKDSKDWLVKIALDQARFNILWNESAGRATAASQAIVKNIGLVSNAVKDDLLGTLPEIGDLIKQVARFGATFGGIVPVGTQIALAMGRGGQAMKDLGDATLKTYGILSERAAFTNLEDVEKKLRAVSIASGDMEATSLMAGQVLEKMGPDILKAVEAAQSMRVKIPPMMEDVALAIEEKNRLWLGDLMTGLKKTPDAAREGAAGSAKYLDEMGKSLEGSISGGFGRGIEEGTDFGKQQYAAFKRAIEADPIRVNFDMSELDRAITDALSGRRRGTPGMAPS
jgi:hypothetical protein